jgi:hypothetical protein
MLKPYNNLAVKDFRFHGDENLECGILECGAVLSGRNSPTFRKDNLPPFSAHDTGLRIPEDHNLYD